MAIDTALKRYSALNIQNPWRGVWPIPDGTIGAADRQIGAYLYSGILAGGGSDTTPDQFTFTDQTGVDVSTVITSAAVTITGIDAAATITVSGGTYNINGGSFTSSPGTVNSGDQVQARHTSSASYLTATNTTVTIGGVSDIFTSTTRAEPAAGGSDGQGRVRQGGMMVF